MPLHLSLLFVYGEEGYLSNMKLIDVPGTSSGKYKRLTMNIYYTYQIRDRLNRYSLLPRRGRLFQQYVVTAYCSIDQSMIDYVGETQNNIGNECLSKLYDAIMKDYYSEDQYAVSIEEDTAYPCLHSPKTTKGMKINTPYPEDSIRRIQDMESI
ncbi:hypothetical protein Tco_1004856 [Tanacetum coccineum]|uniref:Helitron helicase-like domain-containing protein n=1 Tax=Tanacetum coccineum TaxID=301880 RepID=A0ABQ5FEI6_9ASTR